MRGLLRGTDVASVTAIDVGERTKHGHLRELGMPILFGAVVLLVSATLMLGANISALRGNLASMDHSQQMLAQISQLELERLGLELTVRGYALTGDKLFQKIQSEVDGRRETALARMDRLVRENPAHAPQYNKLMADLRTHAATFDGMMQLGPDRAALVAKVIVDPEMRVWKYRIRDDLAHLRALELGDIADHQRDITSQLFRAFFLAVAIIVAAFLLGGFGVWAAQIGCRGQR
jgi:CHASE3 domain sensor protein